MIDRTLKYQNYNTSITIKIIWWFWIIVIMYIFVNIVLFIFLNIRQILDHFRKNKSICVIRIIYSLLFIQITMKIIIEYISFFVKRRCKKMTQWFTFMFILKFNLFLKLYKFPMHAFFDKFGYLSIFYIVKIISLKFIRSSLYNRNSKIHSPYLFRLSFRYTLLIINKRKPCKIKEKILDNYLFTHRI
jgi:hypothetical protein